MIHHLQGGRGFVNPWESWHDTTREEEDRYLSNRSAESIKNYGEPPGAHQPLFLKTREVPALRATWLGHASVLVEFPSGLRVLLDPLLNDRYGPIFVPGVKRRSKLPCKVKDIPFVDIVLISNNMYDHLDRHTIQDIKAKHPEAHYYVPLRNEPWLTKFGISNDHIKQLDWGDNASFEISGMKASIDCLPCQFESSSLSSDPGQTLWSSWGVSSGGKSVWFAGATGYRYVPHSAETEMDYSKEYDCPPCPIFKTIGEIMGPFDLGLIPIGGYSPRGYYSASYANPFDSVNIFKDVRCKRALAIRWGTIKDSDEPLDEPPKVLAKALEWSDVPAGAFEICEPGETREFE